MKGSGSNTGNPLTATVEESIEAAESYLKKDDDRLRVGEGSSEEHPAGTTTSLPLPVPPPPPASVLEDPPVTGSTEDCEIADENIENGRNDDRDENDDDGGTFEEDSMEGEGEGEQDLYYASDIKRESNGGVWWNVQATGSISNNAHIATGALPTGKPARAAGLSLEV